MTKQCDRFNILERFKQYIYLTEILHILAGLLISILYKGNVSISPDTFTIRP